MKGLVKVLKITLMSVILISMIASVNMVFAATTVGNISIDPNTSNQSSVTKIGNSILGIIQVVGIIIAVGVLMVLGIKYMMGSAEEKAEYKKTMIPYIVGAILIFAATTIANAIYNFANGIK